MKTDTPIKILLSSYTHQTASWLLDVPMRRIRSVQDFNTELPAQATRADLLFSVVLDDDTETTLHIEIQGKSSDMPVASRMMSYTGNIVRSGKLHSGDNICNFVIYVGKGAGANDNGEYVLRCPRLNKETLRFHYNIIRLWEIEAETLLAMDNTALLVLIGQSKMDNPQVVIPKVIKKIQAISTGVQEQVQLLSLLAVLIDSKEGINMIQAVLEEVDTEWLKNPFAQYLINKGKDEGITEGIQQGILQGILEGLEIALESKFGMKGLLLMPELNQIKDVNTLKLVASMLRYVKSPEELRSAYAQSLG